MKQIESWNLSDHTGYSYELNRVLMLNEFYHIATESRIRDVDMAKMMTEFTKNNILFQASTAMPAQANSTAKRTTAFGLTNYGISL